MSETKVRAVRVPEDLWRAAQDKAASEYRTVSSVVVEALRRYVAKK